ncbi:MAG TPA: hypothetical protein DDZ41_06030 [Flavobacterium sp.]|nr:hypothetical protein [Flavobacterium sp.]
MNKLKQYLIQFVGLKLGKHQFDYQIDNSFFEHFEFKEFNSSNIDVVVQLEKKTTLLELIIKHKGIVNVPCDLTGEDFDLSIKSKIKLIVKFGDSFNNENEELLILPHGEYEFSVAQYIYESIILSVPAKRIHPGVKNGTLQSKTLEILENLAPKKNENKEINNSDPRWDNLKKLLTDK